MTVLLDTNAYSQLRRGHARVAKLVRESEGIVFSTVVAGELMHGFHRGSRLDQNVRDLGAFLSSSFVTVVVVSLATADRFGRIAASLRSKGTPIPTNDVWIAAHAMETGAQLLSFDRHFRDVDGLSWIHLTGPR